MRVSKEWHGWQCREFMASAHNLMLIMRTPTGAVTGSALKADSGEKLPCRSGKSNLLPYCAASGVSVNILPTELSHPKYIYIYRERERDTQTQTQTQTDRQTDRQRETQREAQK